MTSKHSETPLFRRAVAIATAFLLAVPAARLFAYLTDAATHPAPNYYTFRPPLRGGSYADPVFGTSIKRISDALVTPDNANGGTLTFVTNEYSTMTPFNKDNTRLILQHESYFALYDGSGAYLRDLPFAVNASSEPRWSRSDARLLYFINGNTLYSVDVDSLAVSVVRAFGEYGSISGKGESDICFDGNHLVIAGDNRDVFVYEISTNTKGAVFNTGGRAFDSLYITPGHNVTVTWSQSGTARYTGIELFNQNMVFQRQATHAGGHMDDTRDSNGSEVLVWANAADPWPIANCDNGIVKVRLSDGQQTCLLELDWGLAHHVSAPDGGGWFFMETYAYNDPAPSQWTPYTNEVLQVALDGSQVRRLFHHRSRPLNPYYYQPRAAVSRDGSRLVFSSNYGLQAQLGLPTDYGDVYLVELGAPNPGPSPTPAPSTEPTPLPSPTPTPAPTPAPGWTRVEQDGPGVTLTGTWPVNNMPVHSAGSAVLDMSKSSTAVFSFTGTGVRWIGYKDQWAGKAKVYLDGVYKTTVDTYAASARPQVALWTKTGLANKPHTLKVVVLGTKRTQSGGKWVWTDAFEYYK